MYLVRLGKQIDLTTTSHQQPTRLISFCHWAVFEVFCFGAWRSPLLRLSPPCSCQTFRCMSLRKGEAAQGSFAVSHHWLLWPTSLKLSTILNPVLEGVFFEVHCNRTLFWQSIRSETFNLLSFRLEFQFTLSIFWDFHQLLMFVYFDCAC